MKPDWYWEFWGRNYKLALDAVSDRKIKLEKGELATERAARFADLACDERIKLMGQTDETTLVPERGMTMFIQIFTAAALLAWGTSMIAMIVMAWIAIADGMPAASIVIWVNLVATAGLIYGFNKLGRGV